MIDEVKAKKRISILIPCYNEEQNITPLYEALERIVRQHTNYDFEYIFVDDGSQDSTVTVIETLGNQDEKVKIIELSRNFGKEIALTAGIHDINSDALIIMDSDLQHPPQLISTFLEKWEEGYEIVATIRTEIENRSFIKKIGSKFFYKLINMMSETDMISGTTDFRLLDKIVVEELKKFTERNRLVRGLIDWMGFNKIYVEFKAPDRLHGEEGYTIHKLFKLAINSFTSFSLFPLKVAGYVGVLISIIFGGLFSWMLVDKYMLNQHSFSPLSYVIVANTFFIGIVLMALGMMALYIGHIHTEVTNRPLFIIRKRVNFGVK
jgi:glycosyltransferase involved in cell wall biosynthesis